MLQMRVGGCCTAGCHRCNSPVSSSSPVTDNIEADWVVGYALPGCGCDGRRARQQEQQEQQGSGSAGQPVAALVLWRHGVAVLSAFKAKEDETCAGEWIAAGPVNR